MSLSIQSMRPMSCPPMIGDFTIIRDASPQYAELEIEMERVAGEELILDSPQTYFASDVLFLKQVPVVSLLFGFVPSASSH